MKYQRDLLQSCMESLPHDTTVPEFEAAFCAVCVSDQCDRSRWKDSRWITRMLMQEEALHNPMFARADDPRYAGLRNTNFQAVDAQTIKHYGGWVDVRADGSVVQHAEAPQTEVSSDKLEAALNSLKKGGASSAPKALPPQETLEEDTTPMEPELPLETSLEEDTLEEVHDPVPALEKPPVIKESRPVVSRQRNTPRPSGIILGTSSKILQPSALLHQKDPWSTQPEQKTKRDKKGRLTVRAGDGKIMSED